MLGLLFGHPERAFMGSEIIERARVGSGRCSANLRAWQKAAWSVCRWSATEKHYRANAQAPVFQELVALVRKTVGLLDPLRAALQPLANEIAFAAVLGSVASGSAQAASDVDVLVVSDHLMLEDSVSRVGTGGGAAVANGSSHAADVAGIRASARTGRILYRPGPAWFLRGAARRGRWRIASWIIWSGSGR